MSPSDLDSDEPTLTRHGGTIRAKLNTDWVVDKIKESFVNCGGCGNGVMFTFIFFFLIC